MEEVKYNWEEQKYGKGRYTPVVSITRRGVMGLSKGLTDHFKRERDKQPKRVKLFYDRTQQALAIVPLYDDVEDAWPLKTIERGGAQIVVNRFIRQNNIELLADVQRYEPNKTVIPGEGDGWLVVLSRPMK